MTGEFPKKRAAIMAFKTLQTTRDPIALGELGCRIAASKRALLKSIEDIGGKW